VIAIFRVDASVVIGTGHVMRCLSLAHYLKTFGWVCHFGCTPITIQISTALVESGFNLIEVPEDPLKQPEVLRQKFPQGISLLVVDHYELTVEFETACRPWARQICVIDDLAQHTHDADILLDQTYARSEQDYTFLVPDKCLVLTGSCYALLRPEFARSRARSLSRRTSNKHGVKRIFVMVGGTDQFDATSLILDGIEESGIDVFVDIVLGRGSRQLQKIRRRTETMSKTKLFVEPHNLVSLMIEADLAIGAGGMSSWERCCLGLPALTITTAINQLGVNTRLDRAGAVIHIGEYMNLNPSSIKTALCRICEDTDRLYEMSEIAQRMSDGRGLIRVVISLIGNEWSSDARRVYFRLMEKTDESMILGWQQSDGARRYSRHTSSPSAKTHNIWMNQKIMDPDCLPMIVCSDGKDVGLIRLERKQDKIELSILLAKGYQGLGIGAGAIRLARKICPRHALWAEIHPENTSSEKAFRSSGFVSTERCRWYKAPPLEEIEGYSIP